MTPPPTMTPQPTEVPTTEPTQTPAPAETPGPAVTVSQSSTEIPATPYLAPYGEAASYRLNLRSATAAKYQIVQVLLNGDRLEILTKAPDGIWLQVIAPDGTEGWVNSEVDTCGKAVLPTSDSLAQKMAW